MTISCGNLAGKSPGSRTAVQIGRPLLACSCVLRTSNLLRRLFVIFALSLLAGAILSADSIAAPIRAAKEPVDYVDPLIASDASRWFFFGAATRPQGMVNPCPDTGDTGYSYKHTNVRRFSTLHFFCVAGPAFMPTTGTVDPTRGWQAWKSPHQHTNEVVEVGYHKVHLDRYGIDVEITASDRVSFFRLGYDKAGFSDIFIPLADPMSPGEASLAGGRLRKVSPTEIEGEVRVFRKKVIDCTVFIVLQLDVPLQSFTGWQGTNAAGLRDEIAGPEAGGIIRLSVSPDRPVQMKLGVSYCSIANARQNIQIEVPDWDFAKVRNDARKTWNEYLSCVRVEGGSESARIKLHTDLFHSLLGRGMIDDANGQYPDYATLNLVVRNLPPASNLGRHASVTASSAESTNDATNAIDGVTGVLGAGEWKSKDINPWIQLAWPAPRRISRVDLYDRVDPAANITRGVLSFSDGTQVEVTEIPPEGSTCEILFPAKTVSWIRFQALAGEGIGRGLSEIRAYAAESRPDHHMYNCDSFWWTHMNLNILWGMVWPDVLQSYIKADLLWYENDFRHRLPRCILAGTRNWTMTGQHAIPLLASGIALGLPGFDHRQALEAMKDVSMRSTPDYPECGWGGIENQWSDYMKHGFVPHQADGFASASKTLEHSYTDWCIAESARKLGQTEVQERFLHRAQSWRNVYDPRLAYMRPRNRDGTWFAPYDYLLSGNKDFCEANGAQYTWFASHDVQGLCNLMGGNDRYCDVLNWHFKMGEKVKFVDRYVSRRLISFANQPDLHTAHLFNYAGQPWLSQKWVRTVRELAFGDTSTSNAGYCYNDEDQGQLGSLSALMAVGLYSARGVVGDPPTYELTAPVFDVVTIVPNTRRQGDRDFTIRTINNSPGNMFIQSAQLNGQRLDRCWIPQPTLAKGGTLTLELGPRPNTNWGTRFPPPSQSSPLVVSRPSMVDLAEGRPVSTDRPAEPGEEQPARWISSDGPWPHWFAVDLGTERTVDLIAIEFTEAFARDYVVQVCRNQTAWQNVVAVTNNEAVTPRRLHAIPPVEARHVRVFGTSGPQKRLGLQSLRVYSPEQALPQ